MNFFECTVGGTGGAGNTIMVTCDEQLAGQTITCTDGTKTYTKNCPSTAPYTVLFEKLYAETWTISATIGSSSVSTTVEVSDYFTTQLLADFTWRTWVDTASQLDSSDYDSLDEVLADEKALRELFLEHACVDYMAEATSSNADLETIINDDYCAKWINNSDYALDFLGANTVIKALMDAADKYGYGEWIITDDTTTPPTWGAKGNVPVMTANNAPYGTASAYQVFDGNASTTASGTNFSYKFVNPICPKDFYCNVSGGTLQASNDGSTWLVPTSGSYYLYLRLHFASSVSPHTIQFYGRELKVSVPTMTSNTAPFGEVSASSEYSGLGAWKAFDGDTTTNNNRWCCGNSATEQTEYIQYKFTTPTVIKKYVYYPFIPNGLSRITNLELFGSNDGRVWDSLDNQSVSINTTGVRAFDINNSNVYTYYRLAVTANGSNTTLVQIYEANFFGLDYSEKEFEVGTTKKWLYDHGVELVTFTYDSTTDSASNITSNDGEAIFINNSSNKLQGGVYCQLDVSDYDLYRAKVGDVTTTSTNTYGAYAIGVDATTPAYTHAQMDACASFYSNSTPNKAAPNNIALDISSFSTTVYVIASGGESSSASGYNKNKFTELWLE